VAEQEEHRQHEDERSRCRPPPAKTRHRAQLTGRRISVKLASRHIAQRAFTRWRFARSCSNARSYGWASARRGSRAPRRVHRGRLSGRRSVFACNLSTRLLRRGTPRQDAGSFAETWRVQSESDGRSLPGSSHSSSCWLTSGRGSGGRARLRRSP
jgi:hypothetical protein